ncbi:MAG: SDR family oxidoreductase [Lishizhenia sp.]
MRILITGANGLLGQKIVNQLNKREGVVFLATATGENRNPKCSDKNYSSLDITKKSELVAVCDKFKPDAIINTAAMTNVDACEDNRSACLDLNVKAVQYLFDYCRQNKIHLQQLSTDFVFDGVKGNYNELDTVNPLSFYGKSKVEAETILQNSSYSNWSVLRTIIILGVVPGMSRSNLLLWAKGALERNETINVVDDQFRAPTWADDLAWACIEIVVQKHIGVYHVAGPETMSVLEIVKKVAKHYKLNSELIQPISSLSLKQKAARPPKTGFDLSKIKKAINYTPKSLNEILVLLDCELKR